MAKRSNTKLSSKNIIWILVAVVVLVGLLVALAYSPVGQKVIDMISTEGGTPGTPNSPSDDKVFTGIGSNIVADDGSELLGTVTFEAHFVDVAQGDAMLLRFNDPSGTVNVLLDAGSDSPSDVVTAEDLTSYLSAVLGDEAIDIAIVTHPDTDHYDMMDEVFEAFTVEEVYYNEVNKNQTYERFMNDVKTELGDAGSPVPANGGTYNVLDTDSYSLTIYAPGYNRFWDGAYDENNRPELDADASNGMSLMVVVEVAGRKLLFTGDATGSGTDDVMTGTEQWFIENCYTAGDDYDFLKVAHHGSNTSSALQFLQTINPEYCVISCDDGTKHGHPDPEVMNKLFDEGVVTYRTNRHGNIVLLIDTAGKMAFNVEKEVPVENNTDNLSDLMLRSN